MPPAARARALRLENEINTVAAALDRFVRASQTYVAFALAHPALLTATGKAIPGDAHHPVLQSAAMVDPADPAEPARPPPAPVQRAAPRPEPVEAPTLFERFVVW